MMMMAGEGRKERHSERVGKRRKKRGKKREKGWKLSSCRVRIEEKIKKIITFLKPWVVLTFEKTMGKSHGIAHPCFSPKPSQIIKMLI